MVPYTYIVHVFIVVHRLGGGTVRDAGASICFLEDVIDDIGLSLAIRKGSHVGRCLVSVQPARSKTVVETKEKIDERPAALGRTEGKINNTQREE